LSADQPADQMDNNCGTTPEIAPEPPQEILTNVHPDVEPEIQPEFQADAETVYSTVMEIEAQPDPSSTVDAWQKDYQHPEAAAAPKIRGVALLAGEMPVHVFSVTDGLISEPPVTGQVLVVTNERVIAFCQAEGKQETYLVPLNEVKHVVVKAGSRSVSMLLQGSLMVVAGIFIYMVLGYWLTNQIEGPTIPVLHMDVAPFIALIIVLAGLTMIAQVYFTKPDGTVTVQGDGLQFTFQFQGDTAQREIFDVVNTAFATRQTKLEEEVQLETADSVSPWESTSPSP